MPKSKNSKPSDSAKPQPASLSGSEVDRAVQLLSSRKQSDNRLAELGLDTRPHLVISLMPQASSRRSAVTEPTNSDEPLPKDSKREKAK